MLIIIYHCIFDIDVNKNTITPERVLFPYVDIMFINRSGSWSRKFLKEIDKITKIKLGDQSVHFVFISADDRILIIGYRYYSNNRLLSSGNVRIFKSILSDDNVKW